MTPINENSHYVLYGHIKHKATPLGPVLVVCLGITVTRHVTASLLTTQIQYFCISMLEHLYDYFVQKLWLYKWNEDPILICKQI